LLIVLLLAFPLRTGHSIYMEPGWPDDFPRAVTGSGTLDTVILAALWLVTVSVIGRALIRSVTAHTPEQYGRLREYIVIVILAAITAGLIWYRLMVLLAMVTAYYG
jgi:hypothetical protein